MNPSLQIDALPINHQHVNLQYASPCTIVGLWNAVFLLSYNRQLAQPTTILGLRLVKLKIMYMLCVIVTAKLN